MYCTDMYKSHALEHEMSNSNAVVVKTKANHQGKCFTTKHKIIKYDPASHDALLDECRVLWCTYVVNM